MCQRLLCGFSGFSNLTT